MNNKFDELAKGMAQSVTRRGALRKFGVGLAGMALACLGLASKAEAGGCGPPKWCDTTFNSFCFYQSGNKCVTGLPKCNPDHYNSTVLCPHGSSTPTFHPKSTSHAP